MPCQYRILFGLALTLLAGVACEKIIGIETKHRAIEPPNANACTALSSNSRVGLRIANMIPGDQRVDVCIAPAGEAFKEPLFSSGGDKCPQGVGYSQYTVRLNVGAGLYDVKLVPYGSACSAAGPEVAGVRIDAPADAISTSSTSVVATGRDWSVEEARLATIRDATSTDADIYLRFFHALIDGGNLDAGLVDPNKSPPVITLATFPNLGLGSIAAPGNYGSLVVDADGYMIYPVKSTDVGGLYLGAGSAGVAGHDALVDSFVALKREHHYTLFLIGQLGDPKLPPKLWSCDETSSYGAFAECGEPRPVSIGIFHPNLTDIFTDYIDARQDSALAAIASAGSANTGSSASVLCVPELYSPASRAALKTLVGNASTVVFSDDYPIAPESDLTDQSGNLPQYKDVVCDGELQEQIHALETCFLDPQIQAKGCITAAEADAGASKHYFAFTGKQAIGCAAEACQTEVGTFVFGSFESHACFMCAIAHLSSGESIEDMYAACSSPNGGKHHFVYGGSTGMALIIKPPLTVASGEEPRVIALPASTWNRAGLRVPIKLPNNAVIDVWCASVRAPNSEPFLPNGGPYHGAGTDPITGAINNEIANAAEESLQISRLVTAVNSRVVTSQRRAVVTVLTYASPQVGDLVSGLHPENFALFSNPGWWSLVAPDYVPACTYCSDNPLNSSQDNQWTEHIFGIGILADDVTETQRTFMEKSLSLVLYSTPDGTQTSVPVSQYYGIQSTVRISQ